MGNIHQQAHAVNRYLAIGYAGDVQQSGYPSPVTISAINKTPAAKQVTTMAVSTATASATYTFTINGYAFSFVNGASTDTSVVAALIVAAANADPRVRAAAVLTASTSTITFTAVYPGVGFTLTEADGKLGTPSTTTASAEADTVPFGRAVIRASSTTEARRFCALADDAFLTAQSATVTITYAASAVTVVTIEIPSLGVAPTAFSIAHSTDASTTGGLLATAINNSALATYLTATNTSGAVEIVADTEGLGFKVSSSRYGAVTGTAAPTNEVDLRAALLGVAIRRQDVASTTYGETASEYQPNEGVEVLTKGLILVESTETVGPFSDVYVGLATGEEGKFYASSGTGRIRIADGSLKWEFPGVDGAGALTDGLNYLSVNLG